MMDTSHTHRSQTSIVLWLLFLSTVAFVDSFSPAALAPQQQVSRTAVLQWMSSNDDNDEPIRQNLDNLELAWRHAKKPLLRIGSKGATLTHGNSLRQLLNDHTVVKVKFNTRKFGTMQDAFEALRNLCQESGAPEGIELIQAREGDKVILFGLPGTLARIEAGDFPPPVVTEEEESES